MYSEILFTNILRLLKERRMTKVELSARSGVSVSFLSDLTAGHANPSLETMADIANALDVSLLELLEISDIDRELLNERDRVKFGSTLPPGYSRVTAVLPDARAFVVRKWDLETRKRLKAMNRKLNENKPSRRRPADRE